MTTPLPSDEAAFSTGPSSLPEDTGSGSAGLALTTAPSATETLSLEQMSSVRTLMQEMLKRRQVAAVPLGTLELLLGKIFRAALSVDPGKLMQDSKFTASDYVKMLHACAKLADAMARVELVRARLQEIPVPRNPCGTCAIPAEIIDAVEKQLNLL